MRGGSGKLWRSDAIAPISNKGEKIECEKMTQIETEKRGKSLRNRPQRKGYRNCLRVRVVQASQDVGIDQRFSLAQTEMTRDSTQIGRLDT